MATKAEQSGLVLEALKALKEEYHYFAGEPLEGRLTKTLARSEEKGDSSFLIIQGYLDQTMSVRAEYLTPGQARYLTSVMHSEDFKKA